MPAGKIDRPMSPKSSAAQPKPARKAAGPARGATPATQPTVIEGLPTATDPAPADAALARTAEEILARLNEPQREAVTHIKGPLLILAGAGSGKTRVLAHRVAYLVALGFKPWQIVAVTFTNKAANEMRERIAGLIGEAQARDATIGTFHAICARILRRDGATIGLSRSFNIADTDDQESTIKKVLKNLDLDEKRNPPRAFLHRISAA